MTGAQGIKNRRGELQRVLSREESYVDGKLSRAAFISIAILTFITFVGNFTQLQLSSALPIIVSEFHISVTTGQWLTSVFQLVMGVMVPLTAFLTRRFSTRQIVICSMAVFRGRGHGRDVASAADHRVFHLSSVSPRIRDGHGGHGHERGAGHWTHAGRLANRCERLALHIPDHDRDWRGLAGGGHVRTA